MGKVISGYLIKPMSEEATKWFKEHVGEPQKEGDPFWHEGNLVVEEKDLDDITTSMEGSGLEWGTDFEVRNRWGRKVDAI